MEVNRVMTRGVECTTTQAGLQEAARRMRDLNVGSLPVCGDGDRLVGMITDRDIAVRAVADGRDGTTHVADVMTPSVIYCFEDQDVSEAAGVMKRQQIRRLPVLNRQHRLVGILALADLAVDARDERLTSSTLEAVSTPAKPDR